MRQGKDLLVRIVAMLTRMIDRGNQVREGDAVYGYANENVAEAVVFTYARKGTKYLPHVERHRDEEATLWRRT